ncbi:uncharacterized protein LOC134210072 [Armigeres subalbatus]|uniref:uncharacterized protein LOC134210072 n=1 Tax=Armigeres subalbatus TaxID=124917 RepID=UPI002ED4BEBF
MKISLATPLVTLFSLHIIVIAIVRAEHDGKYSKNRYGTGNHGKYVHTNGGDYVEDVDRYRYVHYDDGDRGRYIHVHFPYDGGYGNYAGGHEPFRNPPYDASGLYAYVQKPKNESCLRLLEQYYNTCSDSSLDNPFKSNEYDIKQPSIYLEYGTPEPEFVDASSPQGKLSSASSAREHDPRISSFPATAYLPVPKPPRNEYLPPVRPKLNSSSKLISTKVVDINSKPIRAVSGQESKIESITKNPDITRNHVTVANRKIPESTTTTASPTTTATTPAFTRAPTKVTAPVSTRTLIKVTSQASTRASTRVTTPRPTSAFSSTKTTTSTRSPKTTVPLPSIEEQLHQCRSELQAALLKLSHSGRSKCDLRFGHIFRTYINRIILSFGDISLADTVWKNVLKCIFGEAMKCLIVLSLLAVGCALAQNYNDGQYYPEVYAAKFDDGKWRPDNSGAYQGRTGVAKTSSGVGGVGLSGAGGFGSSGVGGSGSSRVGSFGSSGVKGFGSSGAGGVGLSGVGGFGSSGLGGVGSRFAGASVGGSGVAASGSSGNSFGAGASNSGSNNAFSAGGGLSSSKKFKTSSDESSDASKIGVKEDTRELNEDGSYYYKIVNDNNIEFSESGRVENVGTDDEAMRATGYYEYIGDDGVLYRVDYVADENGFQPTGSHLPTPPPIPNEILQSLQQRGLIRK